MVLKNVVAALLGVTVLAWNHASMADDYRPGEFLQLDLSRAALSPRLLGPPTQFEPVAVEAKSEPKVTRKTVAAAKPAPARTASRHTSARTRLAHRHGNPLDAQARDTRIQVWPCHSGGICNWQH